MTEEEEEGRRTLALRCTAPPLMCDDMARPEGSVPGQRL